MSPISIQRSMFGVQCLMFVPSVAKIESSVTLARSVWTAAALAPLLSAHTFRKIRRNLESVKLNTHNSKLGIWVHTNSDSFEGLLRC